MRCSSVTARDPATLQKISTREDVLLTCCPPAPDDLDTLTSSSLRGIESESLTARTFPNAGGGSLTSSPPAKEPERREERQKSPRENDQQLWSYGRQRRTLEHVGAQRIVHRRQRKGLYERLDYLREVR